MSGRLQLAVRSPPSPPASFSGFQQTSLDAHDWYGWTPAGPAAWRRFVGSAGRLGAVARWAGVLIDWLRVSPSLSFSLTPFLSFFHSSHPVGFNGPMVHGGAEVVKQKLQISEIESDITSHASLTNRKYHTQRLSTSDVKLSKTYHFACSLPSHRPWCSPDLSLSLAGVGERRYGFFSGYDHSLDRRVKNTTSFDMCSVSHSLLFMNPSLIQMLSTHTHTHSAQLSATGAVSDSVPLTHEHSPIVGTTSWGWPIGYQERAPRAERYVGASKSQLWVTPGSKTLLSLLLYASEGDALPLQALGSRGVKDDRRVRHPWIPAPGCVEPLGALLAGDITSLGGVDTSSSNHPGSHNRIDEAGELKNSILILINLILTILYVCMRVKKCMAAKHQSNSPKGMLALIIFIMMITDTHAVNTRGSTSSASGVGSSSGGSAPRASDLMPNIQKDWDFLPGVKRWNGHPYHDFLRIWFLALCVALGSIVQDGNTLLSCAEGNDEGRDAANDPPDRVRSHVSRSARVYACILNYIEPRSRVYRIAQDEFPNDGPGLFKWLKSYGKLDYDDDTKQKLAREWDEATMAKVGIKFTHNSIFEWLDYVDELGDKLGRTQTQRRKKFLDGFPESFEVIIAPERMTPAPGRYVFPTHYPASHPKAGTPHPKANQPDLFSMAMAFNPEWVHRINNRMIRSVPRGSVYHVKSEPMDDTAYECEEVDESEEEYEESYAVSRKQITSRSVCGICGGRGHYGSVEGMECLTKQLKISIPRQELAKTRYPDGITYPFSTDRPSKSAFNNKPKTSMSRVDAVKPKQRTTHRTSTGKKPQPRRTKSVRQVEDEGVVEHEYVNEEQHGSEVSCESGDDFEASKFAVAYHTIDTRYNSYSSDSDTPTPRPKPSRK